MKKAIVIGASSGIGYQLAIILAKNDYMVGITGRRSAELEGLKATSPTSFLTSSFDCTKESNALKLEELTTNLAGLDLLIFCSGTGDLNKSLNYEIENGTNQLNVIAFTEIATWAINFFEKQGKGHFISISSIAGIRGSGAAPAYNASKAYQINYLEGLRQKTKKMNIPVNVTDIRPGFVDTNMAKGEGLFWVSSKEKAAAQIFEVIKKKKDVAYVTKRWWAIAILLKVLPKKIYNRL